jgi:hypothetical protein
MKARREEEAIIADGPQEQGLCGPWGFGAGPGRNRADAGAQLTGCRVTACPQPRPGRPVFEEGGRKIGLLRHQVKVYRRSLRVVSKKTLTGPCSVGWLLSRRSFVHPSDLPLLNRTINIRGPKVLIKRGLMMQFSRRIFFRSRIGQ